MPKKILLLFVFLNLLFAREVLIDNFDTITQNLTALPKSPPVILTLSKTNVIGSQGNALRITTKYEQNKPILQYDLKKNGKYFDASGYQALVFYVKSDTGTSLELALGDPDKITPFASILPYLPEP